MINHLWSPQISKTNDLHNKKTHSGFPPSTPFFSQNPQVDNRKKKTSNYEKLGGHQSKLFHNLSKPSNLSKIGSDHFLGPTKLTGSRFGPKNHRQQNIPLGKSSTPTYRTPVGICKIVPFGGGHLIVLIVLWWNLQVLWWWYIWTYHFSLKHQRLPLENLVFKFWVEGSPGIIWPLPFPTPPKEREIGLPQWICSWLLFFLLLLFHFRPFGPSQMSTSDTTNVTGSINSQATYSLVDLVELPRSLICGYSVDHDVI